MTLELIGAGFGRTGTWSTFAALNRLGFPSYHMQEVIINKANKGHLDFWRKVAQALAPGGAAYLIDSAFDPTSTAKNHVLCESDASVVTRKLNDGREFRVVKIFYEPALLAAKLSALGFTAQVSRTKRYFVYGEAKPRS